MDISLYLESAIKQTAAIQNEFKQPNETVSKIEQKTSSRNQSVKCFQCDNPHNPKSCPIPLRKNAFFAKIRDTRQKFAEKSQVVDTYQAFFQCIFENYPGREFGG